MPGSGFLAGTTSPASTLKRRRLLLADGVLERGAHRLLGRGRGDGERPARRERLVDDAGDARTARHLARRARAPCRPRSSRCQRAISSRWPSGSAGSPFSRTNSRSAARPCAPCRRRSTASRRTPTSDQRTGSPSCSKVSLNAGRCPKRSVSASTPSQSKNSAGISGLPPCAPCPPSRRSACARSAIALTASPCA